MAKDYAKPRAVYQKPIPVDEELRNAHDELIAKRKLTLIIPSNVFLQTSSRSVTLFKVLSIMEKTNAGHGNLLKRYFQLTTKQKLYRCLDELAKLFQPPLKTTVPLQLNSNLSHLSKNILMNWALIFQWKLVHPKHILIIPELIILIQTMSMTKTRQKIITRISNFHVKFPIAICQLNQLSHTLQ